MPEVLEAYGDHHVLGADGPTVLHGRAKSTVLTVCAIEPFDEDRHCIDLFLFLKPLRVGQVKLERQRFHRATTGDSYLNREPPSTLAFTSADTVSDAAH
jgi:hypothetical protein